MSEKTQVFLSYKFHGDDGSVLPDYHMAKNLAARLGELGLNVFFSDDTLGQIGQGDYKGVIDDKLDEAEMVIVVSTSPENCKSNWVRYEWDSFFSDLLSGRKKGELISYLDAEDVSAYPRTIRTRQVFKKDEELEDLLKHVKSYFNIVDSTSDPAVCEKGSSYGYDYGYELGDEIKRLAIQGLVESSQDQGLINSLFTDKSRRLNVLDVGCSAGDVTFRVFEGMGLDVKLLGVDKFESCVEGFNEAAHERGLNNMSAELLNFEDPGWEVTLEGYMRQHDIDYFDLVYCALSLHHMSDSERVLKRLWKYIRDDGFIFVRTCDDALKIAYPKGEQVLELIQMTAKIPRVSDRFHGRKIVSFLHRAKFQNIRIESFLVDTLDKDMDGRHALFYTAFVWRKNYFKRQLDAARTPEEAEKAMAEYNKVQDLLEEIEDLFSERAFYFGYYVTIAIGQKKPFSF